MTGRVSGARRAPPRVRARTCSARAGVALRRGGPCGAPEPLEAHPSPGTRPMCTPRGGGRSTRGSTAARAREDLALGTGRRREGAHCTPARPSRCGGRPLAKAQHAHARLRARRARRVDAGRRRDPWQSPSYPGSPREARSARTCKAVLAHFTPLSRNLRHLRPCRGGARGAAGPPRAAGGSVAVSGRSLGPHVVAWVLAEGRRPHARAPTPCGPHPGAPSSPEPWPPAGAPRRVGKNRRGAQQPLLGP